jgi:uncharacterized protein
LRNVKLGGFLGRHVDANNRVSLLEGLKSPIPAAFDTVARSEPPPESARRLATDSDFYKWLEGACYAIAYDPSLDGLRDRIDHYARMILKTQSAGGYLGTRISPAGPFDAKVKHDLYVAGHFLEAAVAHYAATGCRDLLDAAVRLADFYLRAWKAGHDYFRQSGPRDHPEIELGLVRLYRATGERRFLDFAADIIGLSKIAPRLDDVSAGAGRTHAVRLCYLMSGVAEHHVETGSDQWYRHLPDLWNEIVTTRMYVTGGIGYNEIVPARPCDLPQCLPDNPNRDIAETCASVALMMWSWRMHGITGDSRCFDVIETILYNHYLGAISQDHLACFYYNPLRRTGDLTGKTDHGSAPVRRRRLPRIHSTSCCLPNSWRFFAQLPEYVFSHRGDELRVNLFTTAKVRFHTSDSTGVNVSMETTYPEEGKVLISLNSERRTRYSVGLRIPAWCQSATVSLDGGPPTQATPGHYHVIGPRQWRMNNRIVLEMSMEPQPIAADPRVSANAGQVAFRRGPLIYCLERQDAGGLDPGDLLAIVDPAKRGQDIVGEYDHNLGLHVLKIQVRPRPGAAATRPDADASQSRTATLVPFYFRANRQDDTRWVAWIERGE